MIFPASAKKNVAYLENFLANCRQLNRSEHTIENYKSDLKKFLRWYEIRYPGSPLHRVSGETISDYQDWLAKGGSVTTLEKQVSIPGWQYVRRVLGKTENPATLTISALAVNSRKRHLSALKNFFEYLKQGHEDRGKKFLINPVKTKIHGIRLKDVDIYHTPMLTDNDWDRIEQGVWSPRERLMVSLLYYGGLRLAELAHLKVESFDFDSKTLTFERKGGKIQTLFPVQAKTIFKHLNYWLDRRNKTSLGRKSEWLFPGRIDGSITTRSLYNTVMGIFRRTGVPLATPHSFRKARATKLYLETKDLLQVRDYLGHTDAKVTQTYIDKKTLEQTYQSSYSDAK